MATWMEYRSRWIDPHRRHTPVIAFDGLNGGMSAEACQMHPRCAARIRRAVSTRRSCVADRIDSRPRTEGSAKPSAAHAESADLPTEQVPGAAIRAAAKLLSPIGPPRAK